jgi:thiamine kinase-like enzyme
MRLKREREREREKGKTHYCSVCAQVLWSTDSELKLDIHENMSAEKLKMFSQLVLSG